ncbi:MAG: hypothetical protein J0H40_17050 [Rhizobiales bacterium]|nr:hypothetical protein [Hyphomicrobiales bacterium]
MSERIWILNLNEFVGSVEFSRDADVDAAVHDAIHDHMIRGHAVTRDFSAIDPRGIDVDKPAAIAAKARGLRPVFVVDLSAGSTDDIDHVCDWLAEVHLHSPRHHRAILNRRMSFRQMIDAATRWHESMRRAAEKLYNRAIERDDEGAPAVLELDGEWLGWRWVWLKSDAARDAEGFAMGNCVGGGFYDDRGPCGAVFSLRDPNNVPHVTAELEGIDLKQASCRGGDDVSDRFKPLIDLMAAIIGVRLMIHNDPTVVVEDGLHVIASAAAGDQTTMYVQDSVMHSDGGRLGSAGDAEEARR